jgi:carboxylesterase type B
VAMSIKWVKDNIQMYHGDNEKIFLSGHSAGISLRS